MLDIALIRKDPDTVRNALLKRMDEVDLDAVVEADRQRREQVAEVERLRGERKRLSKQIGALRAKGDDSSDLERAASALGDEIARGETVLSTTEQHLNDLMLDLPNMPSEQTPAGGKEANRVVRTWGEPPRLGEGAKDHVELSTTLGLVDYARGTKLGGNGYWLYTGMGAALEWALLDFFCREHFAAGYEFMLPPHVLTEEAGYASGQFPKFYDDVFHLEADEGQRGSFLLPTSETAIVNVYRDEIIPTERLPIKAFAYTPCYRREAGSHRTQERGTIRGHQFNKVEMFQFVAPEDGPAALDELVERTEDLVRKLGLHFQTSLLAARDASASMRMTYDVEVWIPSIGSYKEVSSASWAGDYQARRARVRYRPEGESGTTFVHTLNASGLATSRLLPAILEQNQQADGSVVVPEVLRPWVGTDVLRPPS